jgi:hypothetical protein
MADLCNQVRFWGCVACIFLSLRILLTWSGVQREHGRVGQWSLAARRVGWVAWWSGWTQLGGVEAGSRRLGHARIIETRPCGPVTILLERDNVRDAPAGGGNTVRFARWSARGGHAVRDGWAVGCVVGWEGIRYASHRAGGGVRLGGREMACGAGASGWEHGVTPACESSRKRVGRGLQYALAYALPPAPRKHLS